MSALSDTENVELRVVDETPTPRDTYTDEEVYVILTGQRVPLVAAAPLVEEPDGDDDSDADVTAEQTGAMIALVPTGDEANRLTLAGGEATEDLHMTLVYLGDAAAWDLGMRARLVDAVTEFCQNVPYVIGNVFGAAEWNPDGTQPAIVLNVGDEEGCECLGDLHEDMREFAEIACMGDLVEQHEPWVPHICVAYSTDAALLVQALSLVGPTTFDRVRVAFAGEYVDIPLYPPTNTVAMNLEMTMPYDIRESDQCPASTPWGLFKKDGGKLVSCHASKEMAQQAIAAIHAAGEIVTLGVQTLAVTGEGKTPKMPQAPVGDTNLPVTTPGPLFTGQGTPWYGALVVEGAQTGDGRLFSEGSLTWPQPPFPLSWQRENLGGHNGSVISGRIDDIWRLPSNPNVIMGKGVFDDQGVDGAEPLRQVQGGFLKGVSVDVDSVKEADVEMIFPPSDGGVGDLFAEPELTIFHGGRIRGATLCALPAYVEAAITLGEVPPELTSLAMPTDSPAPSGGYSLTYAALWPHRCGSNPDINRCATGIGATLNNVTGTTWSMAERRGLYEHLAAHVRRAGLTPQEFTDSSLSDEVKAMYASLNPVENVVAPPTEVFANPNFAGPTALHVVQADGYQVVRGHAALWASCHLSFPDTCVTPPHEDEHVYYRLGEVVTASGEHVPVGPITLATGHASPSVDPRRAVEHYDNTGTCVALVASGNDDHGIWVAGIIKPGTPPGRVMELAGAKLSGDWRRIAGKLRLVAMLAVNVPGFPVPRLGTRVVNGVQTSLVAAGLVPDAGVISAVRDRDAIGAVAASIARRIGRDPHTRAVELRARVFGVEREVK